MFFNRPYISLLVYLYSTLLYMDLSPAILLFRLCQPHLIPVIMLYLPYNSLLLTCGALSWSVFPNLPQQWAQVSTLLSLSHFAKLTLAQFLMGSFILLSSQIFFQSMLNYFLLVYDFLFKIYFPWTVAAACEVILDPLLQKCHINVT